VLVLLVAGVLVLLSSHSLPHPAASTLRAQSGLTFWTVEIERDGRHMTVHAAGVRARPVGYRYQLWAWPEHGDPVSLVPLPTKGQAVYDLDSPMQQALGRAQRVAVLVEASGPRNGPPKVILIAPLEAGTANL
jgi:anti-sigma-K factor RskA